MPAGDAQRVWFPEMIEELKTSWSSSISWDELADLCARMSEKRKQIHLARGIQPPKTRCPECGKVSRSDISGVSIRSALALEAFGQKPETSHDEGAGGTDTGCHQRGGTSDGRL